MDKRIILITITFLIISTLHIDVATASPVDEAGAYMVKKGFDLSIYGIGDSMISLANGGNTSINRTETPNAIMNMLTYSVDPYKFQFVQEWQNTMFVFYVAVLIIVVIFGAVLAHQSKTHPERIKRIYYITRNPKLIDINTYKSLITTGIALMIFGTFGIFYILKLEYITNALIVNHALTTAPPLIDNIVGYLFMSLSYLVLSITMGIRNIIILTIVAGSLGLFAFYLIPPLRNFAISVFMYFIVILFMQPLLLFVSAIGLAFIGVLPLELLPIEILIVVGLFLILSGISTACIFAAGIIKNIVYTRGF